MVEAPFKPKSTLTSKTPVSRQKPWEQQIGTVEDIGNIAPRALRTGVEMVPAGPAETSALAPMLVRWIMEHSPFTDPQDIADFDAAYKATKANEITTDYGLGAVRENITDPLLGPGQDVAAQTPIGGIVQTGLELAPSIATGPGTTLQKLGMIGTSSVGAEGAEAGAQALVDKGLISPKWVPFAHGAGALAGGFGPAVYNRFVNPYPIPPTRQPAVDIMETRNVPLSVGQRSGNERLLKQEQMAGGPEAWEQQPAAFTRAATETQGGFPPGTDVLPNVTMRAEYNRMGAEFDRMANISQAPFSPQLQNDLLNATIRYQENPVVGTMVENIVTGLGKHAAANGGRITGEAYRDVSTRITDTIRNTDDSALRGSLMEIKDILDNAIEQNLPPVEQGNWRTVRQQYRDYLPIELAKSGQGQVSREGFITPQSLTTGIRGIEGRREVAAGERPMTQLAEAGGTTMVKPPTSGTPEGLRAQLAGLIPTAVGGAGLSGLLAAGIDPALASALGIGAGVVSSAVPKIRDAYIRSGFGQNIMGRNLAPRIPTDRDALAATMAGLRDLAIRYQGDLGRR